MPRRSGGKRQRNGRDSVTVRPSAVGQSFAVPVTVTREGWLPIGEGCYERIVHPGCE